VTPAPAEGGDTNASNARTEGHGAAQTNARTARRVVVEADGGARGNPGPAGYGALVRDAESGRVLAERSGSLGVTTNNVAEYTGLVEGLAAAAELGAAEVTVRMDSRLVVEQMSGRWRIRHAGLRPLAARAAALASGFSTVRFEWVPRERNARADALANRAMDAVAGIASDRGAPAEHAAPSGVGSWAPRPTVPTRLILVRHGRTEFSAQRRFSGRGDVPLSGPGRAEAQAVADRIARMRTPDSAPIAAVVSSPLTRCTTTAEAIVRRLGDVPVRVEPDLIECDFGVWEGLTFAEVDERFPTEMQRWLASTAVAPPGGESFRAVGERVRRVATGLTAAYQDHTIVVVSHVTPIKVMLRDALDAADSFLHRTHLDPAGISIIDSWSDGGVSVRAVNDTGHL
jgi:probable phosphoglycerate mutase